MAVLEVECARWCFGRLDWVSLGLLRMLPKRVWNLVMGLAAERLPLCSSTAEGDVAWRDTFERGARVDDGTVVAQ